MWVGISAVIISAVSPIIVGHLNDHLQGHIKTQLITLMLATTAFSYWFLLLSYDILEVTDCECTKDLLLFRMCMLDSSLSTKVTSDF